MAYIGRNVKTETAVTYTFNITSAITTLTGADNAGKTLAYTAPFVDVYLNGVRMSGADITVTSGTSIVFGSALTSGEVVDVSAYVVFSVANVTTDVLTTGTLASDRLPVVPATKGGTGLSSLGAANTILKVNSGGNALEYGTDLTNSPEVYGFSVDATGNLIVTTTNKGADSISEATYATFDDVIYGSSGMTWSLVGTLLRCTI